MEGKRLLMAAQLDNITVTYKNGMTVNIGNFQNLNPEYTVTADVVGGTVEEAFAKIKAKVDKLLEADVDEIIAENNIA